MDTLPTDIQFSLGTTRFRRRRDRERELRNRRHKEYMKLYKKALNSIETIPRKSYPKFVPLPSSPLPHNYFVPTPYTEVFISLSRKPFSIQTRYKDLDDYIKSNTFYKKISRAYIFPRAFKQGPWTGYIASLRVHIRREIRIRQAFLKLLSKWLYKRFRHRYLNDEDPFTLEPFKQPIRLFDPKARGTWRFEANSLKRHLEHALTYSENLFPCPFTPRHPLTNTEFSILQYNTILEQLRFYSQTSWVLEAFHSAKFSMNRFKATFCVPAKLHALEALCRTRDTDDFFEMIEDYVYSQLLRHKVYLLSRYNIITWALRNRKEDPYCKSWYKCFYEFYRCRILGTESYIDDRPADRHLARLFQETKELCQDYDTIAELGEARIQEQGISIHMFVDNSSSPEAVLSALLNALGGQSSLDDDL